MRRKSTFIFSLASKCCKAIKYNNNGKFKKCNIYIQLHKKIRWAEWDDLIESQNHRIIELLSRKEPLKVT